MKTTPEDQLNLRARHPDFQTFLDLNENESNRVRTQLNCFLDQEYGSENLQTIDVFPSRLPNSPIVVFIHGGYWRALDKSSYSFVAEPFVKNDCTVCVINYRLIPTVDMQTLLSDVTQATSWIVDEAKRFNGNAEHIILSGHSAGGHLALMTYLMNSQQQPNIKAICSLSGVFELQPIRNSYLNDVLNLTQSDVDQFSISSHDTSQINCPVQISVGAAETDFFVNQSSNLFQHIGIGRLAQYYEFTGLNHYQVVHELGNESNQASKFILDNSNLV